MIIVQKFGGSSVATLKHIKAIAKFIKNTKKNNKIVVVVSAMGKTTNELLAKALTLSRTPNLREVDQLLSTGELQSIALLSIELQRLGLDAISLSGQQAGLHTNSRYGGAFLTKIDAEKIEKQLNLGKIVVVAGFQGFYKNGDTTTLGRGGSDTTAVALASALNAKCEIYSDIDCIYSCDPRYYASHKPLHKISYDTMLEMSFNGTKAMEVRAVELAKKYNVEIYTGRSLNSDKMKGTLIKQIKEQFENVKITSISIKDKCYFLRVSNLNNHPKKNIYDIFANFGISYSMYHCKNNGKKTIHSFCIDALNYQKYKGTFSACGSIQAVLGGCITLVGSGLATHPILISKIIKLLNENNINILALEIKELSMSIFVETKNINKCVKLFAKNFKL